MSRTIRRDCVSKEEGGIIITVLRAFPVRQAEVWRRPEPKGCSNACQRQKVLENIFILGRTHIASTNANYATGETSLAGGC